MASILGILVFVTVCDVLFLTRISNCNHTQLDESSNTLVLLHVLFRHGDRAPDLSEVYPKDPYTNQAFSTIGYGQLTKAGRIKEYLIGKTLREKYDNFLGTYAPGVVSAISTDYERTRMSCLLVLAGLFPPTDEQKAEDSLFWQPIPYDYKPYKYDKVLGDPLTFCREYKKLYNEYITSPEGLRFYKTNKKFYDYVSKNTGWNITRPYGIYSLYFVLKSEETMGLKLPEWTNSVWPKDVTLGAIDEYYVQTGTPKMMRIAAGYLLKKILSDTYMKIHNKLPPQKKIFLYSGHENNLAFILRGLGVFYPHFPSYGSYITLEVHRIQEKYGFRILYQNYETSEPRLLTLQGCNEICPIEEVHRLVEQYLPLLNDCEK